MSTPRSYASQLGPSFKHSLWNFLKPHRLYQALRLHRRHQQLRREQADPQLQLYADWFQGDFLHYGYFDADKTVEEISFADVERAQRAYAELILQHIPADAKTVLDVGCGMGGLAHLMQQRGLTVTGLTPDQRQIDYIRDKYPAVNTLHMCFEYIDAAHYAQQFSCVITAESLQYLDLHLTCQSVKTLLQEQGSWIVCDYFRQQKGMEASGHYKKDFLAMLEAHDLTISYEQDITRNVAVGLNFALFLGQRLGFPLLHFFTQKYQQKQPGLYMLTERFISGIHAIGHDWLDLLDPQRFSREKQYCLMVIHKKT